MSYELRNSKLKTQNSKLLRSPNETREMFVNDIQDG